MRSPVPDSCRQEGCTILQLLVCMFLKLRASWDGLSKAPGQFRGSMTLYNNQSSIVWASEVGSTEMFIWENHLQVSVSMYPHARKHFAECHLESLREFMHFDARTSAPHSPPYILGEA